MLVDGVVTRQEVTLRAICSLARGENPPAKPSGVRRPMETASCGWTCRRLQLGGRGPLMRTSGSPSRERSCYSCINVCSSSGETLPSLLASTVLKIRR